MDSKKQKGMYSMKLSFEQVKSAARGVARVEEIDGKINFFRFTAEQDDFYARRDKDFHRKSHASSGVILEFDTDSRNLGMSVEISSGSSRRFTAHSIFADGKRIGQLGSALAPELVRECYESSFNLGDGTKRVKILFPWAACSKVAALTLDDGASFTPVQKEKTVILFGDSITQGYDAAIPENSYASQLVAALDANGINKAIGGEVFCPELASLPDAVKPDLITVAYGTNDWSRFCRLPEDAAAFYRTLRATYPNTPIVALAPVWRADWQDCPDHSNFRLVAEGIAKIAEEVENVHFIDCFGFIPEDTSLYSDAYLHPNDEGFRYYAKHLIQAILRLHLN